MGPNRHPFPETLLRHHEKTRTGPPWHRPQPQGLKEPQFLKIIVPRLGQTARKLQKLGDQFFFSDNSSEAINFMQVASCQVAKYLVAAMGPKY